MKQNSKKIPPVSTPGMTDGTTVSPGGHQPRFSKGTLVDMYCFLNERPHSRHHDMADLIWSETGIPLAHETVDRNIRVIFEPSVVVQRNGSLFLHVVFAKSLSPLDPKDPDYDETAIFGGVYSEFTGRCGSLDLGI